MAANPLLASIPGRAGADGPPPRPVATDALWIATFILITQPYLQWFGLGTASDTQVFPLVAAFIPLTSYLLQRGKLDVEFVIAGLAVLGLAALQSLSTTFDPYLLIRGVFGYASLVIMTFSLIAFIRITRPELLVRAIKTSFFIWVAGGLVQVLVPGTLLMWRDKLIVTEGRGVLSFATEPSYFAMALLLLAVAVIASSGKGYRYIITAVVISLFIAKSAVGAIYGIVALIVFAPGSVMRKLVVAFVGVGLIALAVELQPDSRLSIVLRLFATDPWLLARRDMSFGLRWVNIELPVRGFLDQWGVPHGLYEWGPFQRRVFLETYTGFTWQIPYTQFTSGRILSIHGRLLFELGLAAVFVYLFVWRLIRAHVMALRLTTLLLIMGLNGLTLNSPFLSLVLAIAYTTNLRPGSLASIPPHLPNSPRLTRRSRPSPLRV